MESSKVWLAADFSMPFTYSIRSPISSMTSAKALPTPGPSTVILALLKSSIELLGTEVTQVEIFPKLRTANVLVRPPEKLAICTQFMKMNKVEETGSLIRLYEAIGYREIAHALGNMTIFTEIPESDIALVSSLFKNIGYWGTMDSFANCLSIRSQSPKLNECFREITSTRDGSVIKNYFRGYAGVFRKKIIGWDDLMNPANWKRPRIIDKVLFVWPLMITKYYKDGFMMIRKPFVE